MSESNYDKLLKVAKDMNSVGLSAQEIFDLICYRHNKLLEFVKELGPRVHTGSCYDLGLRVKALLKEIGEL